jgi:hypothetical protein
MFGAAMDESMGDDFRITVIATGFSNEQHAAQMADAAASEPVKKALPELVTKPKAAAAAQLPDIDLPKMRRDAKVIKIGTIISDLGADGEYDIPTFVRQQQVI